MESYRPIWVEHAQFVDDTGDNDADAGNDDIGHEPPPTAVGQDERRMQARAYNYWTNLLGIRNFPQIGDLATSKMPDFAGNAVVLDFSAGLDDPAITMLGQKLADECGAGTVIGRLSDVPGKSLLSRITGHYLQILANQAPLGFEAEFVNLRGKTVVYRGILLPFSSDGATIQHIMGVINWKELADTATTAGLIRELNTVAGADHSRAGMSLGEWADGPATAGCGDRDGILPAKADAVEWETNDWLASARALPTMAWEDISMTGNEIALLLIHRAPDGPLRLLGEVHDNAGLIEQAGRQFLS